MHETERLYQRLVEAEGARMRILLIGPLPPPHGGISVHVSGIQGQLKAAGITCRVLDMGRVRPGLRFGLMVLRHASQGWTLHLHTNGHNVKSWLLAFGMWAGRTMPWRLHIDPALRDGARLPGCWLLLGAADWRPSPARFTGKSSVSAVEIRGRHCFRSAWRLIG